MAMTASNSPPPPPPSTSPNPTTPPPPPPPPTLPSPPSCTPYTPVHCPAAPSAESVEEGDEAVHPDREEREDCHQASSPCQEVDERTSAAVWLSTGRHRVPVDRASHGLGAGLSYCCQLLPGKGRIGKRLGAPPGKCLHALRSCVVPRLEGGGLGCVAVLFEVHPATRFRGLSVQSVHVRQSAAKRQVVREGRHQPT